MKTLQFTRRPDTTIIGLVQYGWAWLLDLAEVLKPARFSVIMVITGFAFLVWVPQGQETLRALAEWNTENGPDVWRVVFFLGAVLTWGLYSWYCARVMLYLRFPVTPFWVLRGPVPDRRGRMSAEERRLHARIKSFHIAVPRFLGAFAFLSAAFALALAAFKYRNPLQQSASGRLFALAGICLAMGLLFIWFVRKRRALLNSAHRLLTGTRAVRSGWRRNIVDLLAVADSGNQAYGSHTLRTLPAATWIAVGLAAGLSFLLFAIFAIDRVTPAQDLGAATILLLAAATWIPFGSALVFIGNHWRLPAITLTILMVILFSRWNDNHAVRTLPMASQDRYPTLQENFDEWYAGVEGVSPHTRSQPLFIVAAEGGGIRAAYWTATVLTQLQDQNPQFAAHVFAISGVSGGSLGAAVFDSLLADAGPDGSVSCNVDGAGFAPTPLRACAQAVLSRDFLAPALGAMLYPDLTQRLLPLPIRSFDRALALEQAWESAWNLVLGNNQFAEPFSALWRDNVRSWIPSLFLNSTWVETGRRIITSNVSVQSPPFSNSVDIHSVISGAMRLSTAADNSARFTFLSPAGTLRDRSGATWGHIVDGGYFENSGTATAFDILAALRAHVAPAQWRKLTPVVLVISNDPHASPAVEDLSADHPPPDRWLIEALAPMHALLATRDARGAYSRAAIRALAGPGHYFVLGLCNNGVPLPLGWQLSGQARAEINRQITQPCGNWNNPATLAQVTGYLAGQ